MLGITVFYIIHKAKANFEQLYFTKWQLEGKSFVMEITALKPWI